MVSLHKIKAQVANNGIAVSVDCVIFGFEENALKVLLIETDVNDLEGTYSLLGDLVNVKEDIDTAAYRVLKNRTGLSADVNLQQIQSFGNINRHPAGRVITIAYYSLINILSQKVKFSDNNLAWYDVKKLPKLAFDHKEVIDNCVQHLANKILEHPLGFSLLPKKFSLRDLQNLYETLLHTELDRRNFRKKFLSTDYLIDLNEMEKNVHHRPGKLYKFDFEKFHERKKNFGTAFSL